MSSISSRIQHLPVKSKLFSLSYRKLAALSLESSVGAERTRKDGCNQDLQYRLFASNAPRPRQAHRSPTNSSSSSKPSFSSPNKTKYVATSLDVWENADSMPNQEQLLRQFTKLDERHQEFLQNTAAYRDAWFPPSTSGNSSKNIPADWWQASQFRHPPIGMEGISWDTLNQSEPLYRNLCQSCHELILLTSSLTTHEVIPLEQVQWLPLQQQKWIANSCDLLPTTLTFWEVLRKERANLVDYYRPKQARLLPPPISPPATTAGTSAKPAEAGWVGWFTSALSHSDEEPPKEPTDDRDSRDRNTPAVMQVIAHEQPKWVAKAYHYTKVVWHLYGNIPPQADSPIALQERATQIQKLVETMPPVHLNNKIARLLVRAHQDVGTLESAYAAEQSLERYPRHGAGCLSHVLLAYLKVTQTESTQHKLLAAKRACALLEQAVKASEHDEKSTNRNDKQKLDMWLSVGLECLANVATATAGSEHHETALVEESWPNYYEQVDRLVKYKFQSRWEPLLKGEDIQWLTEDVKSLHSIIIVYSQDDSRMEEAKQLLEQLLNMPNDEYPDVDIFHAVLHGLLRARKHHHHPTKQRSISLEGETAENTKSFPRSSEESTSSNDLDYGLQLLDKMMSRQPSWPNEESFVCLFKLAETGPQTDEIMTKLEIFRAISGTSMSTLQASHYALHCWANSAAQGIEGAAERGLEILNLLDIQSTPLLLKNSSYRKRLSHIYDVDLTPDQNVYTLVLKTCAMTSNPSEYDRALQIALQVYQRMQAQDIVVSSAMHKWLLSCVADFVTEDSPDRLQLSQSIYEAAMKHDRVNSAVLKQLARANTELHETHCAQDKVE
jgi:hypothetical protein